MLYFKMLFFILAMDLRHGPINIMSFSLGKNNGFFNSLSFIKGSAAGYVVAGFMIGFGRISYAVDLQIFITALGCCSCAYITFVALYMTIYGKGIPISNCSQKGLTTGFYLNLFNPFGWNSSLEGVSEFVNSNESLARLLVMMLFSGLISQGIWTYAGAQISKLLSSPKQEKILNRTLGAALAASSIYLLIKNNSA